MTRLYVREVPNAIIQAPNQVPGDRLIRVAKSFDLETRRVYILTLKGNGKRKFVPSSTADTKKLEKFIKERKNG